MIQLSRPCEVIRNLLLRNPIRYTLVAIIFIQLRCRMTWYVWKYIWRSMTILMPKNKEILCVIIYFNNNNIIWSSKDLLSNWKQITELSLKLQLTWFHDPVSPKLAYLTRGKGFLNLATCHWPGTSNHSNSLTSLSLS